MKTKAKTKMKTKSEKENKNESSFLLSFCFSFLFWFLFLLSKSFCIFVNSTWPGGAIDSQPSLTWPRNAIPFLLNPCGLTCHRRSALSYLAQKCHSIFFCEFSTWPSSAIDGQLSLDWPRSAITPRNMALSLIRIFRIQRC